MNRWGVRARGGQTWVAENQVSSPVAGPGPSGHSQSCGRCSEGETSAAEDRGEWPGIPLPGDRHCTVGEPQRPLSEWRRGTAKVAVTRGGGRAAPLEEALEEHPDSLRPDQRRQKCTCWQTILPKSTKPDPETMASE
ncbi:hypothetical protein NDU88_001220 [Pleurodeles waltl]|uniref:Uncharacterized protein n=1 Tax=Pleurodeles waltl TaxID=8319 RepID=A0AAV7PBW5_PLEWA|nr:hypothetical protein NDU88_001220 [Pleurodeles waltl]